MLFCFCGTQEAADRYWQTRQSVAVVEKHEDGVTPGVENRGWWIDSIVSTSVLVLGSD